VLSFDGTWWVVILLDITCHARGVLLAEDYSEGGVCFADSDMFHLQLYFGFADGFQVLELASGDMLFGGSLESGLDVLEGRVYQ
jgi:hypothetical protein